MCNSILNEIEKNEKLMFDVRVQLKWHDNKGSVAKTYSILKGHKEESESAKNMSGEG